MTGDTLKVKVDTEDLLSDALAFYKGNGFDASRPIRVYYNGQPAIDTGGVKRQFFTDMFEKFVTSPELKVFEGPPTQLLFSYNQQALSSGITKLLGKIVGHSILQGCGGFPYLAPSAYSYLSTGEITKAMYHITIADVFDMNAVHYIKKVKIYLLLSHSNNALNFIFYVQIADSDENELQTLNADPEFVQLLSECGITSTVTVFPKVFYSPV